MEEKLSRPKTLEDVIFWLEIGGYEYLDYRAGMLHLKETNGSSLWIPKYNALIAANKIWTEYYN